MDIFDRIGVTGDIINSELHHNVSYYEKAEQSIAKASGALSVQSDKGNTGQMKGTNSTRSPWLRKLDKPRFFSEKHGRTLWRLCCEIGKIASKRWDFL